MLQFQGKFDARIIIFCVIVSISIVHKTDFPESVVNESDTLNGYVVCQVDFDRVNTTTKANQLGQDVALKSRAMHYTVDLAMLISMYNI